MLTLEQIRGYFPDQVVKRNQRGILVEYLQYELLDSLFKLKEAAFVSFIGGTGYQNAAAEPTFL